METTKKDILNKINESMSDVDEMAYRRKDAHLKPNPEYHKKGNMTGQLKIARATPYWKESNETERPDYWILNKDKEEGKDILVVPLDCQELTEFINENKDWLDQVQAYHQLKPTLLSCKRTKFAPDDPSVSTRTPTGKRASLSETLKTKFNKILREEFGDKSDKGMEFNAVLNKRSIPAIIVDNKKYLNTHLPDWTNNDIKFESLNFNSYESAQDFLKAVATRIQGGEPENMNTYYMARQFNQKYKKWEEDRASKKLYQGKTDVYNLDVRGYKELNLDVTLDMRFSIIGKNYADRFVWEISMINKFGRKRPDEYYIKNGLNKYQLKPNGYLDGQDIKIKKSVEIDPNKDFDDYNVIMDDAAVSLGLSEVISDFKQMVESIPPKSALQIARFGEKTVNKIDGINERRVDDIVKNIIKEIKKSQ